LQYIIISSMKGMRVSMRYITLNASTK